MSAESKRERSRATIRAFLPSDATAVAEILQGVKEAAQWPEGDSRELLDWPGVLALVSEEGSKISGFIVGRQVTDEAEILNLAVIPAQRERGRGGALLQAAMAEFRVRQITRVFLEVRESNARGLAFYAKHGFSKTGRRAAYYRDPDEAAIVMEKKLTG